MRARPMTVEYYIEKLNAARADQEDPRPGPDRCHLGTPHIPSEPIPSYRCRRLPSKTDACDDRCNDSFEWFEFVLRGGLGRCNGQAGWVSSDLKVCKRRTG